MGLMINTNLDALQIHSQLRKIEKNRSDSTKRLSSGLRINSAKDDAAGFAVANLFKSRVSSMRVAYQNSTEALSLLDVADGGYNKIHDVLIRMKELATQAASGQIEDSNRAQLNTEFQLLMSEIDRVANSTTYNDTSLIAESGANLTFQVGARNSPDSQIAVSLKSATTSNIGLEGTLTIHSNLNLWETPSSYPDTDYQIATTDGAVWYGTVTGPMEQNGNIMTWPGSGISYDTSTNTFTCLAPGTTADSNANLGWLFLVPGTYTWSPPPNVLTQVKAQTAMDRIEIALGKINNYMADIGAYQNRFQYAMENLQTSIENYQSSESAIRDADMALEVTSLTKSQILSETGMAMLAQANETPKSILKLIQGAT